MDMGVRAGMAFVELKKQLANSHVMAYFSQDAETHVIVDASPVGLGEILSQKQIYRSFCECYRPFMDNKVFILFIIYD
jgi:hypothetical protein